MASAASSYFSIRPRRKKIHSKFNEKETFT
jgi:hypothetical protein